MEGLTEKMGLCGRGGRDPAPWGRWRCRAWPRLLRGGDGRGLEARLGVPAAHRKEPVGGK